MTLTTHSVELIGSASEMQERSSLWRKQGLKIGLIWAKGGLHDGHEALIRTAQMDVDKVVLCLFSNPIELSAHETEKARPRNLEKDLEFCEYAGVSAVFMPDAREIYPKGYSTYTYETELSQTLCGVSRPHYFQGVTTFIVKLFNLTNPNFFYTGQKDAQFAAVIRKLIADLNWQIQVIEIPTQRNRYGFAISSSSGLLNDEQREAALLIYDALLAGKALYDQGIRNVDRICAEVRHRMTRSRHVQVIYIALVNQETMLPAKEIKPDKVMICAAAWVGPARLLDNLIL